jgi:hypothetical protein
MWMLVLHQMASGPIQTSNTGWVVCLYGAPVAWDNRLQDLVTLGSCGADFVAFSETTREVVWWWKLCLSIGLPCEPIALEANCDSQGAMALADHDTSHLRSNRIAFQFHFVREHIVGKDIVLRFVPGVVNLDDSLTKPLGKGRLNELLNRMGCAPRV